MTSDDEEGSAMLLQGTRDSAGSHSDETRPAASESGSHENAVILLPGPSGIVSDRRLRLYGSDDTRREMHPPAAAGL